MLDNRSPYIWRFETKDGKQGIYQSHDLCKLVTGHFSGANCPAPYQEPHVYPEHLKLKSLDNSFNTYDKKRFGFVSIAQAKRWFDKPEVMIRLYNKVDMRLKVYRREDCVGEVFESKTQAIFTKPKNKDRVVKVSIPFFYKSSEEEIMQLVDKRFAKL